MRLQNQRNRRRARHAKVTGDEHLGAGIDSKEAATLPKTKIRIHHAIDLQLHYDHPINVALRNINVIIRLLFKNDRGPCAAFASSSLNGRESAQASHAGAVAPQLPGQLNDPPPSKGLRLPAASHRAGNGAVHGTASQQDEARIAQIRQIAQYLNLPFPKRFELGKQQIREFLQNRAFITQLKIRM